MTTKDITRFLHQPRRHYAAVTLQQGRSLLDSDFNEAALLLAEDRRRAFVDVTGGFGSPDDGFFIGIPVDLNESEASLPDRARLVVTTVSDTDLQLPATATVQLNGADVTIIPFSILPGSMYLGGMRFELERAEALAFQRDFLQMKQEDVRQGERHLYYLHAWEQVVTAVEDRELIEQSLGGPDTTVRVRRMRRVEMFDSFFEQPSTCDEAFADRIAYLGFERGDYDWTSGELLSQGRLQLVFDAHADANPCTPDPPPQYLGTENQTLRIMLTSNSHFVWAIDNGAPLYRVTVTNLDSDDAEIRVTMLTPPRDEAHKPRSGQVVEFLPFEALIDRDATPRPDDPHFNKLAAEIGVFGRVLGSFSDADNSFVLDRNSSSSLGGVVNLLREFVTRWSDQHPASAHLPQPDGTHHFYLRLWHDQPDQNNSVDIFIYTIGPQGIPMQPLGKTGIRPIFHAQGRRGDYWTATLRIDQRDRIVPHDLLTNATGVAPHGPRHFYLPLAFVNTPERDLRDCRPRIRQLRDSGCEMLTVGDGLKSIGDYARIQDAIDALPETGGRIVVRPGVYREQLMLRDGIVLEGCGEDTILETPTGEVPSALIRLKEPSAFVKVRSFRIHAIEQRAILVEQGDNVEFSGLEIFAYRFGEGGVPEQGSDASDLPLIELQDLDDSLLRSIRMSASRRPALRVLGGTHTRFEAVSGSGDQETETAPLPDALFFFQETEGLRLREVSVQAFGQLGVLIENCTDTVLTGVEVLVGAHVDEQDSRTGLEVRGGSEFVLENSRIVQEGSYTEHAALLLKGDHFTIRDNLIRALTQCFDSSQPSGSDDCTSPLAVAWGGIQIRGQSTWIEIRGNQIRGGLGNGITLGSVRWAQNSEDPGRIEGAGKVQTQAELESVSAFVHGHLASGFEDDSGVLLPFDEGALRHIVIADNRIEEMATNGISALTVLGLTEIDIPTSFFEVEDLTIERNVITSNLRQLPPATDVRTRHDLTPLSTASDSIALDVLLLPYAGITLATVTGGCYIAGNQIVQNGTDGTIPTCGIFILNGDGIVITRNRVLDNGGLAVAGATMARGLRAGIAVLLAGTDAASTSTDLDELLAVEQDPLVEARSLNAGERAGEFALRVLDNVVRQPEGRALHAISTGMVSVDGNFLGSRGYHGSTDTVDTMATGDAVFVQGLGGAWETFNSSGFGHDGTDFTAFTAVHRAYGWFTNTIPNSPRLYAGGGGGVLFHNNQVVYDWEVKIIPSNPDEPITFFPVVIIGQDHVGVIGNQFALRLQGVTESQVGSSVPSIIPEVFVGHALIGGITTQVARNRFSEPVESMRLSVVTSGELLNTTTLNIGTHPAIAYLWQHAISDDPAAEDVPRSMVFTRNPAVFLRQGVNYLTDIHNNSSFKSAIRQLFRLLHART